MRQGQGTRDRDTGQETGTRDRDTGHETGTHNTRCRQASVALEANASMTQEVYTNGTRVDTHDTEGRNT